MKQPHEILEQKWAAFNDLDPAGMVACSSGTAALHLALEALRLPPGSEVITGDFNMIAVPRAVVLAGLTPVFVDCDERLLMGYEQWKLACGDPRITAAVLVAVYGRKVEDKVFEKCHQYGMKIVEDLAEAHGVRPHGLTDAACWSFYKNKIVAGEEGGAVWFRNPEHAKLARQLRSLGFTDAHDYTHVPRGHNYRMSNLHARFILDDFGQGPYNPNALEYYHPFVTWAPQKDHTGNAVLRRAIESWYDEFCPPEWQMPPRDAVWVYDLKLPDDFPGDNRAARKEMMKIVGKLNAAGIAARAGFWPMHMQEEFRGCRFIWSQYVGSLRAARTVFYLPVQPGRTTREDCRRAFEVIKAALPPAQ